MTPEAKQLLKDEPELCKEILEALSNRYFNNPESMQDSIKSLFKEHTTPDWEILSFKGDMETIHSVRRSDGEVFEIDTVTDCGTIKRFTIVKNTMRVECESHDTCCDVDISRLTKLTPLFTTEDRVDIFKGDRTVPVNKLSFKIWNAAETYISPSTSGNWIYFSTREAAEAWVRKNKPKFSEQQLIDAGIDIYSNDTLYPF